MKKNEQQTKQDVIIDLRQKKNLVTCKINSNNKTIETYKAGIKSLEEEVKDLENQEVQYDVIIAAIQGG